MVLITAQMTSYAVSGRCPPYLPVQRDASVSGGCSVIWTTTGRAFTGNSWRGMSAGCLSGLGWSGWLTTCNKQNGRNDHSALFIRWLFFINHGLSDAIWRHRPWPSLTLVQIMACCLTNPGRYVNQKFTYHQLGIVTFIWGQFSRNALVVYLSLIWVWKSLIKYHSHISHVSKSWPMLWLSYLCITQLYIHCSQVAKRRLQALVKNLQLCLTVYSKTWIVASHIFWFTQNTIDCNLCFSRDQGWVLLY